MDIFKDEGREMDAVRARLAETRSRSLSNATRQAIESELEGARVLLDQGLSSEVVRRVNATMRAARGDASLLAKARCLLSTALEMQGSYGESLEAVKVYESTDAREGLDADAT
ncbi:MAG: hypothetical protein QOF61_3130, partial [Acidobacteriota bacterium]|nr:hypothetical protein [Acidobacteriota bacterium]